MTIPPALWETHRAAIEEIGFTRGELESALDLYRRTPRPLRRALDKMIEKKAGRHASAALAIARQLADAR
jgi:hypothetical protein